MKYKERVREHKSKAHHEKEAFDTFKKQLFALKSSSGFLAFFYGAPGQFMSVKLRSTEGKDLKFVKPHKNGGLFNPIAPDEGVAQWYIDIAQDTEAYDNGDTFVFEGEFNQLTFLSQTAWAQRAAGGAAIFQPSCAMGGSSDW